MRRILCTLAFALAFTYAAGAAEIQGVVADWNCVKGMVRDGREKTLRQNRGCSLVKNYKRGAYGLITEEKKFYRLDDPGNQHVIELLGNSPDKDNLKVLVRGEVQGGAIKVSSISIL
jgi:hypothetical protein